MKWVPYPTTYDSDPRMEAAGEPAEILHNRAWSWCGRLETYGRIPKSMVARLCPTGTSERITALLEHELWVDAGDEYVLCDWAGVADEIAGLEKVREKNRERQRRKRERDKATSSPADPQPGPLPTGPSRDSSRDGHANVTAPKTTKPGKRSSAASPRRADQRRSPVSRDCHVTGHVTVTPLEREEIYNPPNPPHSGGNDEPLNPDWSPGQCYRHTDRPSARCRGCGTTPRQLAAAATAAAERAVQAELEDLIERREALAWCGDPDCDRYERRLMTQRGLVKCPACHPDVVVGPLPRPCLTVVGGR